MEITFSINNIFFTPVLKSSLSIGFYIFCVAPSDGLPVGAQINDVLRFDGSTWSVSVGYNKASICLQVGAINPFIIIKDGKGSWTSFKYQSTAPVSAEQENTLGKSLINTPPFQKQFRKTFGTAVNIANNATYNLMSQLLLTDVPANSEANMGNFPSKFAVNSTVQSLIFPKLKYYCKYDIRISFVGTVTGTAGSDRQFTVRLRRGDNTLIGEKYAIKLDLSQLDPMITEFTSFTRSDLSIDPYSDTNNGLKIEIFNNSGTVLTLSGFDLLFQGIPTNNEEF